MQNARENPIAAAAAAAAVSGAPPPQANAENLLDIDFDGAAPASAQKEPVGGMSGLEGLAGTPQRVQSPAVANGPTRAPAGMDDLMGLSNGGGGGVAGDLMGGPAGGMHMNGYASAGMSNEDILGGFASMDMGATSQPPPPPPGQQLNDQSAKGKKPDEDLLGLF